MAVESRRGEGDTAVVGLGLRHRRTTELGWPGCEADIAGKETSRGRNSQNYVQRRLRETTAMTATMSRAVGEGCCSRGTRNRRVGVVAAAEGFAAVIGGASKVSGSRSRTGGPSGGAALTGLMRRGAARCAAGAGAGAGADSGAGGSEGQRPLWQS